MGIPSAPSADGVGRELPGSVCLELCCVALGQADNIKSPLPAGTNAL